jgi:predicted Zn-dependent protease
MQHGSLVPFRPLRLLKGLETGDLAQSKAFLERAYVGDPENENYALDFALNLIRSGEYLRAIDVLERGSRKHLDSREIAMELALSNALAGRIPQTLVLCRTLAAQGDLAAAHLFAAFAECRAGDFARCREEASAGLAAPNANPYLHYLLAEALWSDSKQNNQALSELDNALDAMPACRACLLLRSKVLEATQSNSRAISDLNTLTRLDPTFGPAWARLAVLYRKTGDPEAAAWATQKFQSLHQNEIDQEVDSFREQFLRSHQTQ